MKQSTTKEEILSRNGFRPIDNPIPPASSLGGGESLFTPSIEQSNDLVGKQQIAKPNGVTIEDLRLSPKLADSLSPIEQVIEAQSYLKSDSTIKSVGNLEAFAAAFQREMQKQPSTAFGRFSK